MLQTWACAHSTAKPVPKLEPGLRNTTSPSGQAAADFQVARASVTTAQSDIHFFARWRC